MSKRLRLSLTKNLELREEGMLLVRLTDGFVQRRTRIRNISRIT